VGKFNVMLEQLNTGSSLSVTFTTEAQTRRRLGLLLSFAKQMMKLIPTKTLTVPEMEAPFAEAKNDCPFNVQDMLLIATAAPLVDINAGDDANAVRFTRV